MSDVAIQTINTSTPNSGTGDTIYAAFNKTNNNFSNLAIAVDVVQNNYANTTLGVFANVTVTNRVLGSLHLYGSDTIYINGSPVATSASTFTGGNVSGQANFQAATSSVSSSTGAVVISNGLGVGGNVYANAVYIGSGTSTAGLFWASNSNPFIGLYTSSGAGNITISGTALTLTPTGPGTVSVGSSTAIPIITTDAYGRVIYSNTVPVIAPAGTLTGSTLASGVTASSLTSVGTLTSLAVTNAITSASHTLTGTLIAATVNAATIGNTGSTLTGTIQTTSQPNITTLGGVTSIGASSSTALTGTIQTASQPNITSVGTLTGLTVSGTIAASTNNTINIGSSSATFATVYATTFSGVSTTAKYADLAEKYLADQNYEPGTVVAVGGSAEVTACVQGDRAIGAVSANPAYLMNSELQDGTYIALKGRLPIKVAGTVRKGQRLIAADWGCAQAVDTNDPDTFAIALETVNDSGVNLVEALIL